MKKLTIIVLLLGLLAGCEEKETDNSLKVFDLKLSGCKQNSEKNLATNERAYMIIQGSADGYLYVQHINAIFNCCAETVNVKATLTQNNIQLLERETSSNCNCICPYDLSCKIGPLLSQKYTFSFSENDNEQTPFSFYYSPTLLDTIYMN